MKAFLFVILTVGVLVVTLPFGIIGALLDGWAVRVIWPWFFDTLIWPAPPFAAVVGASLIIGLLTANNHPWPKTEGMAEAVGQWAGAISGQLLRPPLLVALAWLVHLFVTVKP